MMVGCKVNNPKLTNQIQLTFIGDNGEAYFSSDGNELIFQSKRDGYECDQIYVMNLDGSGKYLLSDTGGANTCSYFTLDDQIIFSSTFHLSETCPEVYKPDNPRKYIWPLRNFDIFRWLTSGDIINLTQNDGYDAEGTVHPFEKKIIFTSYRNNDIDLYEMDYDGNNLKRITTRFGYDGGAFYSPDGSKIVWRTWYPESVEDSLQWLHNLKNNYIEAVPLDIYIADADGHNQIRLTENGATNWAPSWHPNGKQIVFASNMDDWREDYHSFGHNFELYLIEIQSGTIHRLTENETFDSFPVFSPDGRKLLYASNQNAENPRQTNIYISDFNQK